MASSSGASITLEDIRHDGVPEIAPLVQMRSRTGWLRRPFGVFTNQALLGIAALFLTAIVVCAVFAPWVAPYDPLSVDLGASNLPPGSVPDGGGIPYFLGTDAVGHDILSRIIFGARISVVVGLLSVALSGTIGVAVGLLTGYFGGKVDTLVMRFVDLQMSIPSLLLALFVLYSLGVSVVNVVIVLAVTRWMVYARLVRGIMLSLRERQFFEAVIQLGARDSRVILRHALPNVLGPVAVLATLETATVMLTEASLSFLGLGVQPPTPSWGLMVADGKDFMAVAWWEVTMPGLVILLTALSLNIAAARLSETFGRIDSR